MWGVLHSNLMLYEANDVEEAMMVHNRILILVSPFQQPQKQGQSVQVWNLNSVYDNILGIMEMSM